jgi:hypothetical protein
MRHGQHRTHRPNLHLPNRRIDSSFFLLFSTTIIDILAGELERVKQKILEKIF